MLRTSLLLAGALVVSAPSLSAQDAEAPQLPAFAEKLSKLHEKPFQSDFNIKGKADGADFSVKGHFAWANKNQFSFNMDMTAKVPFSEEPESGKMSLVADGSYIWIDMNEPTGQRQIVKLKLDTVHKLIDSGGGAMAAQAGIPMSPDQMMGMLAGIPFNEKDQGDSTLISAKLDNSVFEDMEDVVVNFALEVDKKTSFPKMMHLTASEDEVDVKMTTSNVKFPETIPADKFKFTEPEGVMVQDMTMMLEMMLMQGGGVDSEF